MTTAYAHGVRFQIIRGFIVQPFGLVFALASYIIAALALGFFLTERSPYEYLSRVRWKWWALGTAIFIAASWIFKIIAYKNGW